jgi:hypothetical protein
VFLVVVVVVDHLKKCFSYKGLFIELEKLPRNFHLYQHLKSVVSVETIMYLQFLYMCPSEISFLEY